MTIQPKIKSSEFSLFRKEIQKERNGQIPQRQQQTVTIVPRNEAERRERVRRREKTNDSRDEDLIMGFI